MKLKTDDRSICENNILTNGVAVYYCIILKSMYLKNRKTSIPI